MNAAQVDDFYKEITLVLFNPWLRFLVAARALTNCNFGARERYRTLLI